MMFVCAFSVLQALLERGRAVKKKKERGGVIDEFLISSSPALRAVILMWSRGLEAGSLQLPGTLAHCKHT